MSGEKVSGKCIKVGDNVNSDLIIPGRYLTSIDPDELKKHAFEPLGEEFQAKLWASDILIAGQNFGCGSAREQAATCLIGSGIRAVVATSFARVFFRNAINTGLIVIESPGAVDAVSDGDDLSVDMEAGQVVANGQSWSFPPYSDNLREIFDAGGLIPYVAAKLEREGHTV